MDVFVLKVEVEGGRMESCCAMPLLWMNSQTHSRKLFCSDRSFGELGIVVGIPRHFYAFLKEIQMMYAIPCTKNHKATIFCGYLSSGSPGEVKFAVAIAVSVTVEDIFFSKRNLGDLLCVPISVPVEAWEICWDFL